MIVSHQLGQVGWGSSLRPLIFHRLGHFDMDMADMDRLDMDMVDMDMVDILYYIFSHMNIS